VFSVDDLKISHSNISLLHRNNELRYEAGMEMENQTPRGPSAASSAPVDPATPLAASAEGSGGVQSAPVDGPDEAPPSRPYRYYVLGILVVVYTMNFSTGRSWRPRADPPSCNQQLRDGR
jgi:hypothetical protein